MNLPASLLPSRTWETSYRHEDGDLISLFYVPALSCAVQYDRDVEETFGPVDEETLAKVLPQISRLGRERILKALREPGSSIPLKTRWPRKPWRCRNYLIRR